MSVKVKDAIGSKSQTVSVIDLTSGLDLTKAQKKEIHRDVGEFLVDSILEAVSKSESPVAGESWKQTLSPKYKDKKDAEGGTLKPNMELTGQMLDALSFKPTEDGVKLEIFGDRAWVADGHNKCSDASDRGKAPRRRFLPGEGQEFDSQIQAGIERIIADKILEAASIKKSELSDIESKAAFWDLMKSKFGDYSKSEIRDTILRNERLLELMDDLEITSWLK